jgi:hypothetical protein
MEFNSGAQAAGMSSRPAQGVEQARSNQVQREDMEAREQKAEEMMAGLEEALARAEARGGGQQQGGNTDSALGQHIDESV